MKNKRNPDFVHFTVALSRKRYLTNISQKTGGKY